MTPTSLRFDVVVVALLAQVAAQSLRPLRFVPLPFGLVKPEGWLRRELRIQADGLAGAMPEFYEPIVNSQWCAIGAKPAARHVRYEALVDSQLRVAYPVRPRACSGLVATRRLNST